LYQPEQKYTIRIICHFWGNDKAKRRFSRHIEINRYQNDTVGNLSSKDLKPYEIRILSKGLNFCLIPSKINEEQLSADHDTFARFLRIKDYFMAKERDKGSAVVVMENEDYLEEENRQLTDERFYKKLDSDPTKEFSTRITQELTIMKENSHIAKNTFDYLKPDKPKAGRFYLLPKIHKVNNAGRPIVSANGHPTEKNLRIRRFPPSTSCRSVTLTFERHH
jgi:hypothetical protein